jgi:cytochrome P450
MRVARAVFHETFLNLGDDPAVRDKGIAAGHELNAWIDAEIARRRKDGVAKRDLLGALMTSEASGVIGAAQAGHILSGLLVGAIDTTASCVANIMAELVANPKLMAMVKPDAENLPRLGGWCREILRRRPHNPLVLREAAAGASIAGRAIPQGSRVYAITLSAMQDKRVFDKPRLLDPLRPVDRYMHFGRGLHLCSGRDINAIQIPALVGALLRAGPSKSGPVKFDGPFPDELVVRLSGVAP